MRTSSRYSTISCAQCSALKITEMLEKKIKWSNTKGKNTDYRNRSCIIEILGLWDRDFIITVIGKGGIPYPLRVDHVLLV